MELDDLKQSWGKIGASEEQLTEQKIRSFLQNSSTSPLGKIRKNMMAELISILIVLVLFYAFVFLKNKPSNSLYIGLGVLTAISLLILIIVFPRLYNHTKRFRLTQSISYSLQQNLTQLKSDLDLYAKTMLFLYIPACIAGFALSNFFNPYLILFFVVFFPVYWIIVKKWTKLFYGKYVDELQELYSELEEQNEEEFHSTLKQ